MPPYRAARRRRAAAGAERPPPLRDEGAAAASGEGEECRDQAEHRPAQRRTLRAVWTAVGCRQCPIARSNPQDPARTEASHRRSCSFGDGRQEVEHGPVGDELELHVTSLTGDGLGDANDQDITASRG